ncbi:hypothetical protein GQ54DRAFT_295690 [Martensiomyces pterosporus]|nr:hypothetical protein GQ54DRAFT_295690 [Martensiomyces pterosporus]
MSTTASPMEAMSTLSVMSSSLPANHTESNWQGWDTIYVPSEQAEFILFYVMAALNLMNIPMIVYSVIYRSYLPIKAKNVWITGGIGIGGIIFNFSFNVTLGMIGYKGWYEPCRLWSAWLWFTFGMGFILSFVNLRLVFYYRIFISRKTHTYEKFTVLKFLRRWWPFFLLWSPTLVSSILAEILPDTWTIRSIIDHGTRTCDFNFNYVYWVFTYMGVQILVAWGFYFRMRSIAKAFNEFRMAIWTLIFFTVVLVCDVLINCLKGSVYSWGRITLCLVNTILLNMHFWLILGPPIYGHIFKREETLKKFLAEMHEDGLLAQQAHLGNAHKQLYGVETGEDGYIQTSGGEETKIVNKQPTRYSADYNGDFTDLGITTTGHTDFGNTGNNNNNNNGSGNGNGNGDYRREVI